MSVMILFGFALWCVLAILLTIFAPPLLILFFPLKQLVQSSLGFFRETALGNESINYLVAFTVAMATGYAIFKNRQRVRGFINGTTIIVIALYSWALLTCLWSPGGSKGFEVFVSAIPYFVMFFIFLPFLITTLNEWGQAARICLVLGTIITGLILISPEFTMKYGRIGLDLPNAPGGRSNPLALGELGGTCIVLAAFVGTGFDLLYFKLFRIIGVIVGTILVVKSGSRGQLMFAVVSIALCYPISRPLAGLKNYNFTAIGLIVTLIIIYYVASLVVSTGSMDTEKRWAEGSTNEGVDARYSNIIFLLETWLKSPIFWVQGLGFYSFGALNPFGEPYTHCIVVDMLGELGLIGFTLFLILCLWTWNSCRKIFVTIRDNQTQRANFSSFLAVLVYHFLLSNKQGNLAGEFLMIGLMLLAFRIERKLNFYPDIDFGESSNFSEEISSDPIPPIF
jgi:hypothetical protein